MGHLRHSSVAYDAFHDQTARSPQSAIQSTRRTRAPPCQVCPPLPTPFSWQTWQSWHTWDKGPPRPSRRRTDFTGLPPSSCVPNGPCVPTSGVWHPRANTDTFVLGPPGSANPSSLADVGANPPNSPPERLLLPPKGAKHACWRPFGVPRTRPNSRHGPPVLLMCAKPLM
jgi:hypothetical protein